MSASGKNKRNKGKRLPEVRKEAEKAPVKAEPQKSTWVKKRHKAVLTLLRPFFRLHLRLKYGLVLPENKFLELPEPCLIMANHQMTLDPVLISSLCKTPVYWMASDDLFNKPIISPALSWLVAPIPKSKSKSDLNAVRLTCRVLKEGGSVGIFPEGNRSLSGDNWQIDPSTCKLAKVANAPLVLLNVRGGYGAEPRWGRGVRRGKLYVEIVRTVSVEEMKRMSAEEVQELIVSALKNGQEKGQAFRYARRAEYLERALYYCPQCGSFHTLTSNRKEIVCTKCQLRAEYTEDLRFKPIKGNLPFSTVKEWFAAQREAFAKYIRRSRRTRMLLADYGVQMFELLGRSKKRRIGKGTLYADKRGILFAARGESKIPFSQTEAVTAVGKRKLRIYTKDGRVFQLKGDKRFNAVKYLHLFEVLSSTCTGG
ncbi:MAG: 1-acyl-sn-glycerol-3-phosphate acyltransferase [Clostridia bacterium]|nr:1-acyl-sn-glycerol-3-phosphate acyltransferase [Clostridia bacterium]